MSFRPHGRLHRAGDGERAQLVTVEGWVSQVGALVPVLYVSGSCEAQ